jgi:protein-S-isoprenylcysteine O-methyltransferase Ste14
MNKLSGTFFKYRSYTPIPFVIIMLLYANPNVWSIIAGFAIAFLGEMIRLWGVSWAGSETRTTSTAGGTFLIISGPFAHVRNPLYVGNILMYTGLGIMSFAVFPWLQIAGLVFFTVQYLSIIKGEEAHLSKTFGDNYQNYLKNVPRLFPRISAYREPGVVQPPFNSAAGRRSEKRSIQAFVIVAITILLIWFLRRF